METIISRADARAQGLQFYFTGRPCKRGHVASRLVRDAQCRDCRSALNAAFHAKTREHQLVRLRRNNAIRRPEISLAMRANYQANPGRYRNRDAVRRARELAATPEDFGEFDQLVIDEAVEACRRREAATGYAWQLDHMVPLARGGAHAWHNLQVIPAWLNRWKRDRLVLVEPGAWVAFLPGGGRDVLSRDVPGCPSVTADKTASRCG